MKIFAIIAALIGAASAGGLVTYGGYGYGHGHGHGYGYGHGHGHGHGYGYGHAHGHGAILSHSSIAKVSYIKTPVVSTSYVKQPVLSYIAKPVKSISYIAKPVVSVHSAPVITHGFGVYGHGLYGGYGGSYGLW